MSNIILEKNEVLVEYKNEKYMVREDGQVLRLPKNELKPRPLDNKWTYGREDKKTKYLNIAGERVHRIVCTAFNGYPPTDQHIVDHIDTNRQNNRRENLRWVTKLENALNNPITRKKIILLCGSVENFLENPSMLNQFSSDPNFSWMRRVTPEEAKISKERLLEWAESDSVPSGGSLGDWIYDNNNYGNYQSIRQYENSGGSLTDNVKQVNWNTPSEFIKCPTQVTSEGLIEYYNSIVVGELFVRNRYGVSNTIHKEIVEDNNMFYVVTDLDSPVKNFALSKVYIEEDKYIHEGMGTFFEERGALKKLTLDQGLEWDGEDGIDDYA